MSLRVAVVGMGGIGNIHAGIYAEHPDTLLVAVCDVVPEKCRKIGRAIRLPGLLRR